MIEKAQHTLQQHKKIEATNLLAFAFDGILLTGDFEIAKFFLSSIDPYSLHPTAIASLLITALNVKADINQTNFINFCYSEPLV